MEGYAAQAVGGAFDRARDGFESLVAWLAGSEARGLEHGALEQQVQVRGREVLRLLFQDHVDLRAVEEQRQEQVIDADGAARRSVEAGHERALATLFGEVSVSRMAYRRRGLANLYPADGRLNLPGEKHSHGLRRLAAVEGARGSFTEAAAAIERSTGTVLGKRQVEQLARSAAVDVEDFYAARRPDPRAGR